MGTYVVVSDATGTIVNRIVLDDPEQWEVPAGHTLIEETDVPMAIGGTYIDGVYTPPSGRPPDPPPIDASLDSVGTGKTTNEILGVAA